MRKTPQKSAREVCQPRLIGCRYTSPRPKFACFRGRNRARFHSQVQERHGNQASDVSAQKLGLRCPGGEGHDTEHVQSGLGVDASPVPELHRIRSVVREETHRHTFLPEPGTPRGRP